ncbi:MAG: lipopolysaccharide biosynthesis protein [Bacteroidota bacterium]
MKISSALAWDVFRSLIQQASGFIISIILARLLLPEQFGVIAIALAFVNILVLVSDLGLGTGLIQSDDTDEATYSSLFWVNVLMGVSLTTLLYFASPFIANFLEVPDLTMIIRLLSLTLIINSIAIMARAILQKNMQFKKLALVEVTSRVIGGSAGILAALAGWGINALILQSIIAAVFNSAIIWKVCQWRPSFTFSYAGSKKIINFGLYVFLDRLTGAVMRRLDVFFIGKLYSPLMVGYYTRAESLNNFVAQNASNSITRVFFPVLSASKNDAEKFDEIYERLFGIVTFATAVIGGSLFFLGKEIVLVLLGTKWIGVVPFFKILIFKSLGFSLAAVTNHAILSLGKSRQVFIAGLFKKLLKIVPFIIGYYYGIFSFMYALVVLSFTEVMINLVLLNFYKKNLAYHLLTIIQHYLVLAIFYSLLIYSGLEISGFGGLALTVAYVFVLCFFAHLTKLKSYVYLKNNSIKLINSLSQKADK